MTHPSVSLKNYYLLTDSPGFAGKPDFFQKPFIRLQRSFLRLSTFRGCQGRPTARTEREPAENRQALACFLA